MLRFIGLQMQYWNILQKLLMKEFVQINNAKPSEAAVTTDTSRFDFESFC